MSSNGTDRAETNCTKKPLKIAITGVSRGLGKMLSYALVARGHQVFGCTPSTDMTSETPDGFVLSEASVTNPGEMKKFADLANEGEPVDIVIANAGVIHERMPAWKIPVKEWARVMDVNALGVVNTALAFLPAMLERNEGVFIAISSGWGRSPAWGLGPYCASKFAVEGIIGSLNGDLPAGIRAVALDPGNGINTHMLSVCLPDKHQNYISPEEWAVYASDYIINEIYQGNVTGSATVSHPGL
ncbi:SDR family NAD(P)-dependent oxidoreductase [Xenorhabdus sp. PR6a]|uniref:SDR family oxidoreductase n=1 Tax=Xenorhabdus sp. PR6a TaxID=3025877 RepID=UPI0023597FF7|nr:SDR family NAD(P)-dependent oxidoreductase [Xenorhabdus sp. PR6a]MDC9580367.1 SDR family NAD(P)-dependent oxidoreductase [Xenorhabdus sp. PR6a]